MRLPTRKRDYTGGHKAELLMSGSSYFSAIVNIIDNARYFIHFHTYILDEDETGIMVVNALRRASERGVRTYLLLDAFGTKYLSGDLIKSIEESGILFRFFSPTFITRGFHLSLRLHSKVILADGEVAVIGGLNIADRYSGLNVKKEWLDFALLFRGPECIHTLNIQKRLWNRAFTRKEDKSAEVVYHPHRYSENIRLKVLQNNWYRNKIEILRSYRAAIRNSENRMLIFASYFLPGRNERKLLKNASARGVDISIVLAAESDAPVFARATQFLYDFILRNKIKIFEYQPSNLHSKVAVADGKWCTIGSYNMNHLSDYGSVEINVEVMDDGFAGMFEEKLKDIIRRDCRQITPEYYFGHQTIFSRLRGWWSYQMIRILMRVIWRMTSRNGGYPSGV